MNPFDPLGMFGLSAGCTCCPIHRHGMLGGLLGGYSYYSIQTRSLDELDALLRQQMTEEPSWVWKRWLKDHPEDKEGACTKG